MAPVLAAVLSTAAETKPVAAEEAEAGTAVVTDAATAAGAATAPTPSSQGTPHRKMASTACRDVEHLAKLITRPSVLEDDYGLEWCTELSAHNSLLCMFAHEASQLQVLGLAPIFNNIKGRRVRGADADRRTQETGVSPWLCASQR